MANAQTPGSRASGRAVRPIARYNWPGYCIMMKSLRQFASRAPKGTITRGVSKGFQVIAWRLSCPESGKTLRVWPGNTYPLGATWDGAGVNFALFSEHATKVEVCLFDRPDAATARGQIALRERTEL